MDHLSHYEKEDRPWGSFERFTLDEPSTVKILVIKKDEAFSLQTHAHRDEFWRVLSGNGTVTLGTEMLAAEPGKEFFVTRGVAHRVEAHGDDITILEIAFGQFDEQDIIRIEDKYGRT